MLLRQFPGKTEYLHLAEKYNVIPVCMEILADLETPVSLLTKLYRVGKPLFLLESVEGGEKWGRYSFLGVSARARVRVFEKEVRIEQSAGHANIPHHGDPFDVLKSIMADYHPAVLSSLPRFWGGLVGYFCYEIVSFIEDIPVKWPGDKPMGHFMIPDQVLIFDNIRNTLISVVVSFPDDFKDADSAFDAAQRGLVTLNQKVGRIMPVAPPPATKPSPVLRNTVGHDVFRARVEAGKNHIRNGDIIQAVIAQPFVSDAPGDVIALYRAQRFINPSPYLFFVQLDGITLVGSSPETMVRLENGAATLRPIAGTRPRGHTEQSDRALADDLLNDDKERAEHVMLVDLGRNDLGRVARVGTVQVTDLMVVERYSHVMHLVSNITCELESGCDAWSLFKATFPAGTLSGAPKVRAMEIIAELEDTPRGPYGGAVGYISFDGNMDMAITIRTACIENGHLTVHAGAGIVADSIPEAERVETENKAMAIRKALELASRSGATER
ncbi:MAG: anthranilate synthase component I [Desulfobacteraceae bacterium]|nr:anthranilate synthase component I [Desulfobacteraceae bacterium]